MKGRIAITAALLAAGAMLVWWARSPAVGTEPASGRPLPSDEQPAGIDRAQASVELPPAPDAAQRPLDRRAVAQPDAAPRPSGSDRAVVAVRVLLEDSETPVEGVEVRWLAFGNTYPSTDPVARLEFLRDSGESVTTGADGRASIRYAGNQIRLYATGPDGLVGTDTFAAGLLRAPSEGDAVLRVYPDTRTRFRVVDPGGNAVPRAGVAFYTENRFARVRVRADADGLLTVPLRAYGVKGNEVRVQAVAWGGGGPLQRLNLGSPQTQGPIVLPLPEWGEVHVRASADDALDVGEVLNQLRPRLLAQGDTDRDDVRVYPPAEGPQESYDDSGIARFGPVLVGTNYRVQAGFGELEREAEGPTTPGAVVVVDLAFNPAADRFLSVRLLLPDGSTASSRQVDLKLRNDRGYSIQSWYRSRSDSAGVVVVRRNDKGGDPRDLRVTASIDGVPHIGVLPVRDLPVAGRIDLGDVVLEPLPLLVAGNVVDTAGQPVLARTNLEAQCRRPEASEPDPFTLFGGGSSSWRDLDGKLRWLEGGVFELYSEANCGDEARLMAKRPLVALDDDVVGIPFTIGQRDLRVVLETGGRVRFEFLVEDERLVDTVSLQLCRVVDGEVDPGGIPGAATRRNGEPNRFSTSWEGLAPGRYVVQIFGSEYDRLFATEEIEIGRAGAVSKTPDGAIDLRGRIRYVEVAVRGEGRAAVGRAQVRSRRAGAETPWVLESAGLGGLATSSALDLRIDVDGYEPLFLSNVQTDRMALATPLVPVRFEAEGWPATVPTDEVIRLQISVDYPPTPVRAFHFRTFYVRTSVAPRGDGAGVQVETSMPSNGPSESVLLPESALPWRVVPSVPTTVEDSGFALNPFDVQAAPPQGVITVLL